MSILYKKFLRDRYEAKYQVHEPHTGMRLDQFIQEFLGSGFSREAIKEKIKDGDIKIEGRPGKNKPNTKVYEKEVVTLVIKKTVHEDEYWNHQLLELEKATILFEDDNLFAIAKPPFMATHPTGKHLFNCATVFLEEKTHKTVHSVHRIDRETSGVLLLAKNPKAAHDITPLFEHEKVKKCYFFIAIKDENYNGETSFEANQRLGQKEKTGLLRVYINSYPENSMDGKRAKTNFKIIKQEGDYIFGLAFPSTGRQHQIRVHALIHGLPLLGDKLYLGSYETFQRFKDRCPTPEDHDLLQIPRHALHAIGINFPYLGEQKTFICPLPQDLKYWIQKKTNLSIQDLELSLEKNIEDYFRNFDK